MDTKIGSVDVCKPSSNDVGSPPNGIVATIQGSVSPTIINSSEATLGRHLARRLVQVGVTDVFSVPGDFNMTLLDHLIAEPELNLISCCNELNAGYATDGYARSRGVGACVVTFTVGGLSVLNAIAGAYSESLPLICIVGGPNSNDFGTNRILHHAIGLPDFSQELRCFQTVTCYQMCLEAAVEATAEFLNKAVKPVLVGGPKLRVSKACEAFVKLADASGYALAVMPSAKGLVPEHHPHFIGTYWGASSVGYSLLLKKEKAIIVQPDRVVIANGPAIGSVSMKDFLGALAKRLKHNNTAYENYHRIFVAEGHPLEASPREPLRYGSIGWSVGATLGYAQAVPEKRVIACIGDGSFQVTAQDVSTMLRCGQNTIIFLINNGGYTVEVQIHDGPYNVIKNWDNAALVDAIHNGEGNCWTTKVFCEEELIEAIDMAIGAKKDCLCFIEVIVHKDDTSKDVLEFGTRGVHFYTCACGNTTPLTSVCYHLVMLRFHDYELPQFLATSGFGESVEGELELLMREIAYVSQKSLSRRQNQSVASGSRDSISYILLDATKQPSFLSAFDKSGFESSDNIVVAYKPRKRKFAAYMGDMTMEEAEIFIGSVLNGDVQFTRTRQKPVLK
ncbi:Thiamine pyrophosphate enzyme [Theobroma cacao]|nr:Thiamine pyrophosphate enzyme [Theobroma cacao]